MKPPWRAYDLPGVSGSASKNSSTFHRAAGTSRIPLRPSRSSCQNDSGSTAPPGNRQPTPTTATGSTRDRSSDSTFCCSSTASRASRFGDIVASWDRNSFISTLLLEHFRGKQPFDFVVGQLGDLRGRRGD